MFASEAALPAMSSLTMLWEGSNGALGTLLGPPISKGSAYCAHVERVRCRDGLIVWKTGMRAIQVEVNMTCFCAECS